MLCASCLSGLHLFFSSPLPFCFLFYALFTLISRSGFLTILFFKPLFLHYSCHLDHLVAPLIYIRRASSSPLHPFLVGGPQRQPHTYPEGTRSHQVVAAVRIPYGSPSTSYRRKPQEEKGR